MDLFQDIEMQIPIPTQDCVNFVSIFQIDGKPILPPLMTIEKRIEMQMYREKAIQLERKFVAERQERRVQFCNTQSQSVGSPLCQQGLGSIYSESNSLPISSDMEEQIKGSRKVQPFSPPFKRSGSSREHNTLMDCGKNNLEMASKDDTKERLQKLSKSKTICYDNTSNFRVMADEEVKYAVEEPKKLREMVSKVIDKSISNSTISETRKTLHLPLQERLISGQTIPSIFVNPPTPLTGPSNICEVLSASESVDSYEASGFQSSQATQNQATDITEDSEDDSQENKSSTPQKRITGITARVLHFENIQVEQTNISPSSQTHRLIEGGDNSPELCLMLRSPQRSATSPSLKSLSETLGTCSLSTSPRADDTSANSLVRSSSFTLEGPSKVLLDHIREQNRQKSTKECSNTERTPTSVRPATGRQRSTPSPSAWRDTVESKAKRVQKKNDSKSTSRTSSNGNSKSKSTFNNNSTSVASSWTNPLPPLKVKRSPYDSKGTQNSTKSHTRATSAHKHQSSLKSQKTNSVKKSASSTTYTIKQPISRYTLPNNDVGNTNSANNNADIMAEIDNRHRQKLLALIAKQQEEQRRLQETFENQQRMLLDQLDNERYRYLYMETESSKISMHTENVSKIPPVPSNSRNTQNTHKETTALSFDRSSKLTDVVNGYSPIITNDIPLNLPVTPPSIHSSLQRPLQVADLPSSLHASNNITPNNNFMSEEVGSIIGNGQSSKSSETSNDTAFDRTNDAATIINAYARGFLVRRLFQTEQIQRIVQTIRDTLIFVLNLHMETMENINEANTEENIKLKARLLQQLASASRTLHLIFFQTSVKERMEIIARDRKRIKTKLLSMSLKRSPRIA